VTKLAKVDGVADLSVAEPELFLGTRHSQFVKETIDNSRAEKLLMGRSWSAMKEE
jgi:hypothetical protein